MTGSVEYHVPVTGVDPVNAQHLATKAYVDSLANGAEWKQQCRLATASALATNTYANGSSGVGATLTGFAFGALTIDGVTPTVGDRVLVKNEVTQANNGIYTVTVVGGVATLYVLTRATDYDQPAETVAGTATFATEGTANADTAWVQTTTGTITFGSSSLVFVQFGGGAGVSYATPAIVLGSAAAAGAASTVIRSDGTIAAFDTTAPTTQAFGDAAAVGTAAFAARRDHKHAMPAAPSDASLTFTDITTNNSATGQHGFLKKLDGNAAHYMGGDGNWSTPAGTATGMATDPLWAAAGDLAVATGNDAATVLAIGADGTGLKSNGTTAAWVPLPKRYLNKPGGNITRAAATVGAFSTAWQITGVVVASGQNIDLRVQCTVNKQADCIICIKRGSTQIATSIISGFAANGIFTFSLEWVDENPGASTYTYEVQAAQFGGGTLTVYQSNPTTDVPGGTSIFVAEVYTP